MNRREFCRNMTVTGGAIVLAPLIQACKPARETAALPTPAEPLIGSETTTAIPRSSASPLPTGTTGMEEELLMATASPGPTATTAVGDQTGMARVALVRTKDRAEGVRQAIGLLGINPAHRERVLLKPNFNSDDPAPGSTHPQLLRALIEQLYGQGAQAITVADRSGMGNTEAVMRRLGVLDLADEMGFDTLVFDDLEEADWVIRRSSDFYWQDGFAVPKALLDAPCVVQTCNLKTHRFGGHFTLSLKNSVGFAAKTTGPGGYNYMNELHNSAHQRRMIAEINTTYKPALIVLDGVEAFVEGGPDQGKKVGAEVVLAGTDPVAIDAVGVAILRLFGTTPEVSRGRIFEQEQIARAAELGLGVTGPEQIQLLTGDGASETYAAQISQFLLG